MHCVRRAALRTAWSSSRSIAVPRQQVAAIAMQISKANMQPVGALPLSRYFSQTTPVAQEEKDSAEAVVDSAIQSTEQTGSTVDTDTPLESSLPESVRALKNGHSIFISNMTFDATEAHLKEAFGKYGDIVTLNVGRDGRGLSRGFGFITFADREAADRAVSEANSSFWHGRRINVEHRKDGPSGAKVRKPKLDPTNSIYIGNIPYESSDADLNKMFRSLENVTDVRVAVDRNTGWPRGFAHADFADVESAIKAYEYLSQQTLAGRQLRIDYSETRNKTPGRFNRN
ncbi:RNA-binding domain-containing protein [Xylariaceae sp. AK1471]|nr:RNA-binding domain-containing protein [Xylariaceae sp. AK1471]